MRVIISVHFSCRLSRDLVKSNQERDNSLYKIHMERQELENLNLNIRNFCRLSKILLVTPMQIYITQYS